MTDFGYFLAPPRRTVPPEEVDGLRVGDPAVLQLADELLAAAAHLPQPPLPESRDTRQVRHTAHFLAFVLEAHGPDETGFCRPCSAGVHAIPWPCAAVALLTSRLRSALGEH